MTLSPKNGLIGTLTVALLVSLSLHVCGGPEEGKAPQAQLVHAAYFRLRDNSPEARKEMIDSCQRNLSEHEGILYFSVGEPAVDLAPREYLRDFDVALVIVFESKEAHDRYRADPHFARFASETKPNWRNFRIFNSYVRADRGDDLPVPASP